METSPDSTPKKNMRVGLIIFGSLAIVIGALCLLMIPLMFVGSLIPVKGQEPTPLSLLIPGAIVYFFIAVLNIWLGIGSILCRRWARTLLFLWSAFWLITGVISIITFSFISSQMDAAFANTGKPMPAGLVASVKIGTFLFMGLFEVVMPAAFVWFYALRNTRLTCEDRNPALVWTDRCPLSVLILVLWSGATALCLPFMMIYSPTFPLFGFYVQGAPAVLLVLILSAFYGWATWGLYRQKMTAWWMSMGLMLFLMLSYMVSFSQGGLMELYRHMNVPAQTMKILESSPLLKNGWIGWTGILFIIPYAGLMLYVRKYFGTVQKEKIL